MLEISYVHCKPSVGTPILQSGKAKRLCFDCSGLDLGHVILTYHAGSGRSITRKEWGRYLAVSEGAQPSIIVEFVFIVVEVGELLEVEGVAENGADATEALDELVTLGRTVGNKFKVGTKVTVLLGEPLKHGALVDDFHLLTGFLVHEDASVFFLQFGGMKNDLRTLGALEDPASNLQVLEDDQSLSSTSLQSLEGVVDTVADLARVLGDVVEVLVDELLLLDELDIAEGLTSQLYSLVETVLASIRYVDDLDDLGLQTVVEKIGLVEIVLEIGGTSENDASYVDLVGGDEVLYRQFSDLADVVVALFFTETSETQSGLTTTAVLLGKIDGEPTPVSFVHGEASWSHLLVDNLTGVSRQSAEERTVSVHDDETELLVRLEQLAQCLGVKFVVAKV